jgi:hypothetical protein
MKGRRLLFLGKFGSSRIEEREKIDKLGGLLR